MMYNKVVLFPSIPVENFEDHSAPPSPEEKDSGFFMLRKDSERRATLHRILTEDRDKVVANLMETLTQVSPKASLCQEQMYCTVGYEFHRWQRGKQLC